MNSMGPSATASSRLHHEKTYRGETRGETFVVRVEETDMSETPDASVCRTSARELFRYVIEPEDLYLDPHYDPEPDLIDYYESGPRELALLLLTDAIDADVARGRHQSFLYEVVNRLPKEWTMTAQEIREFISVGLLPQCVG